MLNQAFFKNFQRSLKIEPQYTFFKLVSRQRNLCTRKKNIFSKSWHLLGSINQVPNKGDYVAKTINDQPIILTRDNNNTLNTFYNVCQHRGCILLEHEGNSKQIKCGYHGWTYELSGDLRTARGFDKELLDFKKYQLKPIKHYIWMDQIFIKFR